MTRYNISKAAFRFILIIGTVDLFAGMSYEGSRGAILLQQTTDTQVPAPTSRPAEPNKPAARTPAPQLQGPSAGGFSAEGGPRQEVTLGSTDEATGFKYQLVLDSLGAGNIDPESIVAAFLNRDPATQIFNLLRRRPKPRQRTYLRQRILHRLECDLAY